MLSGLSLRNASIIMLSIVLQCRYLRYLFSWRDSSGKLIRSFSAPTAQVHADDPSFRADLVPCGRCIACRLSKAHDWSVRGMLELYCHDKASFVTLTYDDAHLPKNLSLDRKCFSDWVKRFREDLRQKGIFIRVLASGEYGDRSHRPHYHAIVYGFDFPDREPLYRVKGVQYYTSPLLSKKWKFGNHVIGEANKTTIAYCAKYVLKKVTGDKAKQHYGDREPEFAYYPNSPALGLTFFQKFTSDLYPKNFISIDGKKTPIPRYFYKRLQKDFPELFDEVSYSNLLRRQKENGFYVDSESGEISEGYINTYQVNQDFDHIDKTLNYRAAKFDKQRSL